MHRKVFQLKQVAIFAFQMAGSSGKTVLKQQTERFQLQNAANNTLQTTNMHPNKETKGEKSPKNFSPMTDRVEGGHRRCQTIFESWSQTIFNRKVIKHLDILDVFPSEKISAASDTWCEAEFKQMIRDGALLEHQNRLRSQAGNGRQRHRPGHVLLKGKPGTGKTTAARIYATWRGFGVRWKEKQKESMGRFAHLGNARMDCWFLRSWPISPELASASWSSLGRLHFNSAGCYDPLGRCHQSCSPQMFVLLLKHSCFPRQCVNAGYPAVFSSLWSLLALEGSSDSYLPSGKLRWTLKITNF